MARQEMGAVNQHSASPEDFSDGNESLSAPSEFLAEFLSAIMQRRYSRALKYCRLILDYEPHNVTAKEFYPLLEEKTKLASKDDSSAAEPTSGENQPTSASETDQNTQSSDQSTQSSDHSTQSLDQSTQSLDQSTDSDDSYLLDDELERDESPADIFAGAEQDTDNSNPLSGSGDDEESPLSNCSADIDNGNMASATPAEETVNSVSAAASNYNYRRQQELSRRRRIRQLREQLTSHPRSS